MRTHVRITQDLLQLNGEASHVTCRGMHKQNASAPRRNKPTWTKQRKERTLPIVNLSLNLQLHRHSMDCFAKTGSPNKKRSEFTRTFHRFRCSSRQELHITDVRHSQRTRKPVHRSFVPVSQILIDFSLGLSNVGKLPPIESLELQEGRVSSLRSVIISSLTLEITESKTQRHV